MIDIIVLTIIIIGLAYVYITLQDCSIILDRMKKNCKTMIKILDGNKKRKIK